MKKMVNGYVENYLGRYSFSGFNGEMKVVSTNYALKLYLYLLVTLKVN